MERKLLIYDSFTTEVFKGNPAGVLLGADGLKNEEMQNIARELGYPETVFLFLNDPEKIKVKFFTPKEEIDLCGHATIAYETALVECGIIKVEEGENQVNIETNLGTLPIVIKIRNKKIDNIMMYQASPKIDRNFTVNKSELAKALNISPNDFADDIEIVKAYTGVWDLMIPLKRKETLNEIVGDMEKIKQISSELNIISLHPFYIEKIENKTNLYARNFAPIVDIDEEAATGTSNGALIYYLHTIGKIKSEENIVVTQGEKLGRKSKIMGKIQIKKEKIDVLIGGTAVKFVEGKIEI
ncbi:PhzF family phenazine biosynthesis protein [Fusobacterium varium]|uniref:PhzF family phenazine biosynthesis protein n=1 Tax=Fusobacterium varium ATCC 27725 TaxID=469618 RepID=A0ABM6U7E9_FUSVA|nr:PhzF family phenazine biosynthesis protein [Fusobacterium varium]AVQ32315.1 PhzF family phenazine biosynthesis protein [Fusobacterium varium ATCC 27725]EES64249.1 phenazine biosynthesis protein, PhzF family [Fusobacterium varium ATCC 27725]